MSGGKLSARKLRTIQRENRAMELRLAGATYAKIGEALGVSHTAAHKIVARVVARMAEEDLDNVRKIRALEIARLDRLLLGIWQDARQGDLSAIDRALKIMDRRAKLLGLDSTQVSQAILGAGELRVIFEE